MPGTRLFGASWWKVIKALLLYEIVQVDLFAFFTGPTEILNAQGSPVARTGLWLVSWNKYTDTEPRHL